MILMINFARHHGHANRILYHTKTGLYLVAIKCKYDEERLNRICEELICDYDREQNDSIPIM